MMRTVDTYINNTLLYAGLAAFIDIILGESLTENIRDRGTQLIEGLREMARDRGMISNVRGVGSLVAFTLESSEVRDATLACLQERNLLALSSGPQAIRFRMPLVVTTEEIGTALDRIADALPAAVS